MIRPLLVGFATTFKHMFKKKVAVNYPDEKIPMFPSLPRQAGVDARRETDLKSVSRADSAPSRARRFTSRRPKTTAVSWLVPGTQRATDPQDSLHLLRLLRRSVLSAIFMGKDYELAVYSKDDFIWDKEDLLVPLTAPTEASPSL